MDCIKIGLLIKKLRTEGGLTQLALANRLNISDKTVSKWERGLGCPDISVVNELSAILGISSEQLLSGCLTENETDGGNMKRLKFYVCPTCGNTLTATGESEISCCGRRLLPLAVNRPEGEHSPKVEEIENDYYITFPHSMEKEHYIGFVALAGYDRVLLIKLYPEGDASVRAPIINGAKIYFYCTQHGLFEFLA